MIDQRLALEACTPPPPPPELPNLEPPPLPLTLPNPPPSQRLVVAAGETNGPLWACASLGSLAAIHRQTAPQWQVEAVGRTPLFVGERV